ncbi:NAD(P)-binding domain-containing protein [Actinomadura parmotrematis]|uniref:NAD(P)-binding domain-containing protein n=1 Tax=Actinomadura parmotrematis TaxID=2864039 RepID=A0ABS7FWE1_9ACTN|nr:NAD(P)-binding domain-containing protein [Actinomadura parmotrematis]MBW8484739.1 NAD(P)-binding domain-containing protein [Actinomadura parmotrematis]
MNDAAVDVLIVGAGPYGLSVAAHAHGRGLRTRIIGTPMRFWAENMPAGMFLKSEPFAVALGSPEPGRAFTDRHDGWTIGRPIPRDTFVEYGRWFADRLAVRPEETDVVRVDRAGDGFGVLLGTGERVRAGSVVMAIGVGAFTRVPAGLAGLPAGMLSHASDHRDLSGFAGEEVVVIGAGQSALETAVLLAEAGAHPHLVARTPALSWNPPPEPDPSWAGLLLRGPHSGLGRGWRTWLWAERPAATRLLPAAARQRVVRTTLGPAGAWWLHDRFDERTAVSLGRTVTGAAERDGRAVLDTVGADGDARTVACDRVIAATGFAVDVERIAVLSADLRGQVRRTYRSPALGAHFQSSVPGLYFGGLTAAASFGPVMRFVHGAGFCARRIADHIAATRPRAAGVAASGNVLVRS